MRTSEGIDWDTLCTNIRNKNVIPIIGNEMYSCIVNGQTSNAEKWFAEKLFEEFAPGGTAPATLTAATEYLVNEKDIKIKKIRTFLRELPTDELSFPLLEEFLAIEQLLFFINTTTYGDILKTTLDQVRQTEASQENFTIGETAINGCNIPALECPFVLNLLGSLRKSLSPALLEEEMLECINTFLELKMKEPLLVILGVLKSKSLLFIGCSQPSWLMRFLFRNLSNERMASWDDRGGEIIIVNDKSIDRDVQFNFLSRNSAVTYDGNTADFVKELSEHWNSHIRKNPLKPKEIFISYSHRDAVQARLLCQQLSEIKNVKCWFDEKQINSGDNYQGSIASGISSADLFIPLFSNNSLNSNTDKLVNVKGEWAQASNTNVKTSGKIKGKEKPALMLLAIEKIDKAHPVILEYFGKRSVENAFGGIVSDELIKQVKEKLNIL